MEQQKNNSMYIGIIAILAIILIVMGVLLTGKKEESENVFKCTKTATQNGMELEATYNVYYKDKYVTKVIGDEVITIDDENTFAAMKSYLNQSNSVIENIDYYDLTITEEGNKIRKICWPKYSWWWCCFKK